MQMIRYWCIKAEQTHWPSWPGALTDLFLDVSSLLRCRPRKNSRVREAGLKKRDDHEDEKDSSDHRDAAGQVFDQERTTNNMTRVT